MVEAAGLSPERRQARDNATTSTKGSTMRLHILVLTATMALLVAGCGVRGDLELPPSATPEAASGDQASPQQAAPQEDPSFILDGLLL